MTSWTFIALVIGIVGLVVGAELLVKGSASIATRFGIAPVIVGLTVVAFGTSAPELAVSVSAAFSGSSDLAMGNVVGSNTVNILFILGTSAVIGGLAVTQRIIRIDIPLMLAASILVLILGYNNLIGRLEGIFLFAGIIVYTVWLIRGARIESKEVLGEYTEAIDELEDEIIEKPLIILIGFVLAGLTILVIGSQLLVNSATDIAQALGVSDLVIGLTVVAIGTSLPELATSVLAALRGQRDIAVGNVVGSNLFNILSVLGLSSIVSPNGIVVLDEAIQFDIPVMIVTAFILIPICWNGFMIKRWEGLVMVSFYVAYVAYLVLKANDSSSADFMRDAAVFVVPLVLLTVCVTGYQGWRRHRANLFLNGKVI
jgi:cation:H+ antiporter